MVVKQAVVVDVIKKILCVIFLSLGFVTYAQQDSTQVYKKKVLETVEIDVLLGYYEQEGIHAAVTGGIGNEDLQNIELKFHNPIDIEPKASEVCYSE